MGQKSRCSLIIKNYERLTSDDNESSIVDKQLVTRGKSRMQPRQHAHWLVTPGSCCCSDE